MLKDYYKYIENNNFEENYDFNIFKLISDKFYRENFYLYIIAQLLKSKIILKIFLEFIEVVNVLIENSFQSVHNFVDNNYTI